jgi:integrase
MSPLYADPGAGAEIARRRDACGQSPTRTDATVRQYRTAAAQLIWRSHPDELADEVGRLAKAIRWYGAQDDVWSKSTIRSHRAALCQAVDDLDNALGLPPTVVAGLLSRVRSASPRPKGPKARRAASARKRKSFTQAEWRLLIGLLTKKKTSTARILAGLLAFGAHLGLRPSEWRDATLAENILTVRCAKNTNGRGVAATRALVLIGFDQVGLLGLNRFLGALKIEASRASCWQAFYERLAKALDRACREAGIRKIAMYTLRHCALATAKRNLTAREVAAFAGHASDRTAQSHYAKRRTGWPLPKVLARPADELVAKVRANAKEGFVAGRSAALHP